MIKSDGPKLDSLSSNQVLYNNEREFDLLDIIVQLWKGRYIILASTILAFIISLTYLSFAKEKWTSKTTVTLASPGQVANYNAILSVLYAQSPEDKPSIIDLQRQLFNRFASSLGALAGSLSNLEKPLLLKIEPAFRGSSDSLIVSFVADNAAQAQTQLVHYISAVNNEVVKDYTEDLRKNLSVKARELSDLLDAHKQIALNKKQHRIDVINQALKIAQIANLKESKLNQAEYLSDDTLYLLGSEALKAMIENEATKPLDFDASYYNAERALLSVTHLKIQTENLDSFRYIAKADLPFRRDSPKKTITVLLALIIGAVVGSAIVIGRNIVNNNLRSN